MSTGIEVVAIGARTPVGLAAETSAAAVRAGICRIGEYPFVTASGELMSVAADARLGPVLEGADRLVPLARSALDEVIHKLAKGPTPYRGRIDLRLALPEARPGLSEDDVAAVAESLAADLRTPERLVHCDLAGRGHAGVAQAIERAVQGARRHDDALTVVLGVDSYLHPDTLVWLEQNRQFGPDARSGFIPGEGAGCLVLASTRLRKRLGLRCLAVVGRAATAHEVRLPGCETGSLGVALTQAVMGALTGLELPRDAVDTTYLDINGERYRSEEWGFVALQAPSAFKTLRYEAPADCWGDVGAASGALASALAVQSWARGYARGPRALVMAGSPHGLRGAILLQDPSSPRAEEGAAR